MKLFHQTGFAPGSIARVNHTPAGGLVQVLHSAASRGDSFFKISAGDAGPCLLDEGAGAGAKDTIVRAAFFVLTNTLQC